jgi:hypothetical protein
MKTFDLNIVRILENWDLSHALREIIANALDEAIITGTKKPQILKINNEWIVRDFGRGIKQEHLLQNENSEKRSHPHVIGQYGIGLKDALATFDRDGVTVTLKSKHGDICLKTHAKHNFELIKTLHATVSPPSIPETEGTTVTFSNLPDESVARAKDMFLVFNGESPLESTKHGEIYRSRDDGGAIYVNGLRVSQEPNFLFSYNITSINSALRKSMNRERQSLGRSSYASRIKDILLEASSDHVVDALIQQVQLLSSGASKDEASWIDVQQRAVKLLSAKSNVVFVDAKELEDSPNVVDLIKRSGKSVVCVPESLNKKIEGDLDSEGSPVTGLKEFIASYNSSFEFDWVLPETMSQAESDVWNRLPEIEQMYGGRPAQVRQVKVSRTMCPSGDLSDALGLWIQAQGLVVIRRDQLRSVHDFAGTVIHEFVHAETGFGDVSRNFESYLTKKLGQLAALILRN